MQVKKFYRLFFGAIAAFILIMGCSDDNNNPAKQLDPDVVVSVEQSIKAQNTVNQVVTQVNTVAFENVSFLKNSTFESDCPKIEVSFNDTTQMLDSIILDYGEEFCVSFNGRQYKGRVILVIDTAFFAEVKIFFDNFCSEDFCMDGEFSYDFEDGDDDDFSLEFENGHFEDADGNNYTLSVDFDYEQIAGADTEEDLNDDVFLITGTSSGTMPNGDSFSIVITTPLQFSFGCEWIMAGVAEFQMTGMSTATIDYGDGECDNKATVTIEGVEQEITM